MEEDRSALFNQLKEFSQRKLKKVETKVVTGTGEQLVEKRGAKGLQVLSGAQAGGGGGGAAGGQEAPRKLDLQVGFILPGLLLGKCTSFELESGRQMRRLRTNSNHSRLPHKHTNPTRQARKMSPTIRVV